MPAASTFVTNDAVTRTRVRKYGLAPQQLIARIEQNLSLLVEGACERLGRAVAASADRPLLETVITVTPVAGEIDLSTASFKYCLIGTLNTTATLKAAAGVLPMYPVARFTDLLARTAADVIYYFVQGRRIIIKNPVDASLSTYVASTKINLSYIPIIGDATFFLPDALEDQLIDRLGEIADNMGGLSFLQMDPADAQNVMANMSKG